MLRTLQLQSNQFKCTPENFIDALIIWKLHRLIISNNNLHKQSGNQFHVTIDKFIGFK